MNIDQDKSRIERLKKGLYSRNAIFNKERSKLPEKEFDIRKNWEEKTSKVEDIEMVKNKSKRKIFLERILLVAVVFLFVSTAIALLTIFGGINRVSTENVDISVVGPASIESGGELSLQITVTNNNATDLELADLIIEYPEGTYSVAEQSKEINIAREKLDTIPSGKSIRKEVKAILYGEENSEKNIIVSLEYRIAGSNAIFFKDRKYEMKISSSPINLLVSPINEGVSGQEIEFSVSIMSNAKNPLEGLLLIAEYPFGFEFKSAIPKPDFGDNGWEIKDSTAEETVVKIRGIITGQNEEERVFKFSSGTRSTKDEKEIGALFASLTKSIIIKKPFLGIDIALNGDTSSEYISKINKSIRADIIWSNNSQSQIINGEIQIKLNGEILDKSSVSVDKGFYRSSDNTIIWNSSTSGELKEIAPGDNGRLSFSFQPINISSSGSFVNPKIVIEASTKGSRISESGSTDEVKSSISRTIKFSSDLTVMPRATYYTGLFTNTGLIPPKVDKETTYTITWTVTNTSNDISDVKVSSSLPAYVRWMGVVSPFSEDISYNPVGGGIVWKIGEIKSGTGIVTSAKEISFQVAILPSVAQVGQSPNLTNDVNIEGTDRFTNNILRSTSRGITTKLSTDPGFTSGGGNVVE